MTFKPPDCFQCHNCGYYRVVVPKRDRLDFGIITEPMPTQEVYCDCWHGEQLKIVRDRMNRPDYLTVDCFKELGMLAGTEQGRDRINIDKLKGHTFAV